MKQSESSSINCNLKELRIKKGLSQTELADKLDIKRQAVYDIETGRYLPNTLLALRLARILGVSVEDIFEEKPVTDRKVEMEEEQPCDSRITVANVRGKFIGFPLGGKNAVNDGLLPADGLYKGEGFVQLFKHESMLDNTALLLGCDPAFGILSSHIQDSSDTSMHYRFASSRRALEELGAGRAHVAGTHLHNSGNVEANERFAREIMGGQGISIIAFSEFEEGILVAPGNPHDIKRVEDLTKRGLRFANRENGAALRILLDDILKKKGILPESINGYNNYVYSHAEGAQLVSYGLADAALGLRAVAGIYGLDFITISSVRCDLVIPADLMEIKPVKVLLDVLQTKRLRMELQALSGYSTANTGKLIAQL